MNPALIAQIILLVSEVAKIAVLLEDEDLTPEQAAAVKAAVRQANAIWESS